MLQNSGIQLLVVGLLVLGQASGALASDECDSMDTLSGDAGDSMLQRRHRTVASSLTVQNPDHILRKVFTGRQEATVQCDAGYYATSGGCRTEGRGHSFHTSMPVGDPPTGWKCAGNTESIHAVVLCTRQFRTTVVSATSEDWVQAQCPDGYYTTGAGCQGEKPPQAINLDKSIARCGGHGGQRTAYAVCTNSSMQTMTSGGGDGGDWETPTCPADWTLVGGGCRAYRGTSTQMKFETSMPSETGQKWICGGHGGGKQVIAICIKDFVTPAPTPAPPTPAPTPALTPAPTFSSQTLSGTVINAETGHAEAGVKVAASVAAVVKDGLSDAAGKWQISDVPAGNGTLSYIKTDFVTVTANISVSDHVPVQPLSASVSHVLPPKDWRILLEWAAQPNDLDSYTFMGGCKTVKFSAKSSNCSGTSVTLDLDDTNGNGPETTTLKNLPDCGDNCNVVFKVQLYAGTGGWSNSDARVTVIHGGSIAQEFAVGSDGVTGDCRGRKWWAVFTLNGKTGALAPYTGDVCAVP